MNFGPKKAQRNALDQSFVCQTLFASNNSGLVPLGTSPDLKGINSRAFLMKVEESRK